MDNNAFQGRNEGHEDPFALFDLAFGQDDETRRDLAHSKRFLERFTGDDEFADSVRTGAMSLEDAARECGCQINLSSLRPVFDEEYAVERRNATPENWRLTFLWDAHMKIKYKSRDALRLAGDSHRLTPKFDLWRARNMNRASLQLGMAGGGITHPPVTFELSDGCSVGCWFCGISAKEFKGHAHFGDGSEWRATLQAVKEILGEGLRYGFCYWATDPLDNPDYLKFLEVFHEEVGVLPQTTSAIPLRNVDLTKGVLELRRKFRGVVDRFSIMTTRKLIEVHETFTPEELLPVELVLQMNNAKSTTKFKSGRAYKEGKGRRTAEKYSSTDGTIACVSGFLINIVKKSIKLISPTMPSETWPNGYIIYDECTYESVDQIEGRLADIVNRNMRLTLDASRQLRLVEGGVLEGADKLSVNTVVMKNEDLKVFGEYFEDGTHSAIDIVKYVNGRGIPPTHAVTAINRFWAEGVIDEAERITVPAE